MNMNAAGQQPNPEDLDTQLRTWAVASAVAHLSGIPAWRRPASPMPIAREMYEFVKEGRDAAKPKGQLTAILGPAPVPPVSETEER